MEESEIKKIIAELGLITDGSDLETLRHELRIRISESHPDQKENHSEDRLQQLTELLKSIGPSSTGLVSTPRALQPIARPQTLTYQEVETKLTLFRASERLSVTRSLLVPRITLGAITAGLTGIFALPKKFMDHPFVGPMLKSTRAPYVWFGLLGTLGAAWTSVWWIEQIRKKYTDRLLSLPFQKKALDDMDREGSNGIFSASSFRDHLCEDHIWYPIWVRTITKKLFRRPWYYYKHGLYDDALMDQASELALERFLSKGWIVKVPKPQGEKSMDDWYRFSE